MLKWLLVVVLALVAFSGLMPLLRRFGLGRLPCDFEFRARGRVWRIPLGSTLLLSLLATLAARVL